MNFEITLFGQLKDQLGKTIIVVPEVNTIDELKKELIRLYPELSNTKFVIAVDRKIIPGNIILNKESEIALLPPFSGG
jgi:molybdopterin synthase sulfur carrier subunit